MTKEQIRERLFNMRDLKYRDFSASLMPTLNKESIIGVRVPDLRAFAKKLVSNSYSEKDFFEIDVFLSDLPHDFFEENNLHAFIVSDIKNFSECIKRVEQFLPFVDNWATCDSFRPACFSTHKNELLPYINKWISSDRPYTVRFGIEILMLHFLDDGFSAEHPETVSKIRSKEYYVNMMIAWYFATALAKQYENVIFYLEKKVLPCRVHNKTIRKACESYRITKEQKEYLRALKIKICKQ